MTLEQRVRRLERSCHLWRAGFLAAVLFSVAACASNRSQSSGGRSTNGLSSTSSPVDAEFAHLTVRELTVRAHPSGPEIVISTDQDRALMQVTTAGAVSSGSIVADKNGANLFLVRRGKAITSAALSVDEQSGSVNLQDASGKSKVLETE
jgi:hypothetical protein